ncbi:twin-arginine translocation signal domain-containing protein [Photobacterium phosphoreum]|jgi:nitrous oxide reductase|uniref:Transcriptional initiation protein Tat n=1 Tax=Photobacterium phosphoreum TaxID=659 RepID=A0A2T3JRZ6_PHOPO|nr:twin-arginine translocation signal domain-containing protein [Photobacterium phosphoreum]KJF85987.1 transcriptional initiation protein Tat [Photobacterium phosphoreum]MCD9464159.1 transcriptional initiation protein Tat [Photobacterium phosphoreum]MCD9471796.1 transcriptional initiation protein Tat [Photobacterium phosphoreum]MCD9475134.1 twin-arginine translocation signal domain-containing protein [Photobacterium phosphoreum]MCD9479078.1 twin-arginine translocation signal domain-containing 
MSEQKTNNSRRQLLKNIGLTVAAGAVVAGTTTAVQASTAETENKEPKTKKGYHETQHIRDYYNTL